MAEQLDMDKYKPKIKTQPGVLIITGQGGNIKPITPGLTVQKKNN